MMPKSSLRAPWARRLTALAAVSLLTVAACDSGGDGVAGGTNVTVVAIVTIPNLQTLTNLVPLTTRQFLGVPTNSAGNWVDKDVTWSSSSPAVATVSATGLVTAQLGGGTTYIRATAGGKTDSVAFLVRFRVKTITLTPASVTLNREGGQALTTTTLDSLGATVTGRTVTYVSSDPTVATVSATGVVTATATAVDSSTTTITATAANALDGGVAANGTKLVTVFGDARVQTVTITGGSGFRGNTGTVQLTATARSGLSNVIVTPITWGTSAAGTATVSGTGLVTLAGNVGALTITATATGAGAGGGSPSSTTVFEVATTLAPNTPTALAIPNNTGITRAINATGLTSFTVTIDGTGTGDADMIVVAPGVTTFTASSTALNAGAGGCVSGASGNAESCTRAAPAAGWWRLVMWAWGGAAFGFLENVGGTNVTFTTTP